MKLKEKMLALGFSPKKEFTILIVGNLISLLGIIISVILLKSTSYIGVFIGISIIFSALFLNRYDSKFDVINQKNLEDFTNLFSYFRIYICNGFSVYSALKEIKTFANPSLRELLEKLIREIDEDKSVQPFVKFAKNFNDVIVEEMMISIYQIIDDGEQSDYLRQFEMIFDKFSEINSQKNLKNKDSKLSTLTGLPLGASCYLIVVLTLGIMSVMGELVNGL